MRRWIVLGLLTTGTLLALWSTTGAQIMDDGDPCHDDCQRRKTECITRCGEHPNPMECEATCRDELEDCLNLCDE